LLVSAEQIETPSSTQGVLTLMPQRARLWPELARFRQFWCFDFNQPSRDLFQSGQTVVLAFFIHLDGALMAG
jgi:hypothetical protein